jgi:hypothetical protein
MSSASPAFRNATITGFALATWLLVKGVDYSKWQPSGARAL